MLKNHTFKVVCPFFATDQQWPVSRPPILKCRLDSPVLMSELLLFMRMREKPMVSRLGSTCFHLFFFIGSFLLFCKLLHHCALFIFFFVCFFFGIRIEDNRTDCLGMYLMIRALMIACPCQFFLF